MDKFAYQEPVEYYSPSLGKWIHAKIEGSSPPGLPEGYLLDVKAHTIIQRYQLGPDGGIVEAIRRPGPGRPACVPTGALPAVTPFSKQVTAAQPPTGYGPVKVIAPSRLSAMCSPPMPASGSELRGRDVGFHVGPFKTEPTSFPMFSCTFLAHGAEWEMQLSNIAHLVPEAVSMLSGQRIQGLFSPMAPVTLPMATRKAIGIPDTAAFFMWSYPTSAVMPQGLDLASNPHYAFLLVGGYAYLNAQRTAVVGSLAVLPSPVGALQFKRAASWQSGWGALPFLRFKPVSLCSLRDHGVRHFCWLCPSEFHEVPHGAFAYLLNDPPAGTNMVTPEVFFAVKDSSETSEHNPDLNLGLEQFSVSVLKTATNNFADAAKIGAGSFGAVYKGMIFVSTEVAVKKLTSAIKSGFNEEVQVLSRIHHPNVVTLMGFAREEEDRYLVYELMKGGDVGHRMKSTTPTPWLFQDRISVSIDAARGLVFLANVRPPIFHRDLTTGNVMIDQYGAGKIGDFGTACLALPDTDRMVTPSIAYTPGYGDPMYLSTGVVTEKTDVHAFGMVLLSVLTGRDPVTYQNGQWVPIFASVRDVSGVLPMIDQIACWPTTNWPHGPTAQVAWLALRCIAELDTSRPNFKEVYLGLSNAQSSFGE